MLVGIACSPDSYRELPIPVRDGYIFDGWYYDIVFTKKIEFTSSIDIKPVPKYDNKCQVGFEDIEIYAKWKKIIFDKKSRDLIIIPLKFTLNKKNIEIC